MINTDSEEVASALEIDSLSHFMGEVRISVLDFGKRKIEFEEINFFTVDSYVLVYFASGSINIFKDGEEYSIHAGAHFLVEPFHLYEGKTVTETEVFYFKFSVDPYSLTKEFEQLINNEPIAFEEGTDLLNRQYTLLDHRRSQMNGYYAIVKSFLIINLARMANRKEAVLTEDTRKGKKTKLKQAAVHNSIEYVLNHLNRHIKVQDVAKESGVSDSILYDGFMEMMGVSPSNFFMKLKLRIAQRKLLFQNETVKQVASELGFSSPYHFSNAYKKEFGVSPSQAKKEYRERCVAEKSELLD